MMEPRGAIERILLEWGNMLAAIPEIKVVSLALYGSWARGNARPDSDVDVLVVCDGLSVDRAERERLVIPSTREASRRLRAALGPGAYPVLSPVLKTVAEAQYHAPLYLDMVHEARLLRDEGGFLRGVLDEVKANLERLGSRRVAFKGGWYWDLKPDYRPGEVFEI